MSNETIMLAKGYNFDKLDDTVFGSVKLDGVPVRIGLSYVNCQWRVNSALSRQGEHLASVKYNAHRIADHLTAVRPFKLSGYTELTVVGEVMHDTARGFKNVSGIVRRQTPQHGLRVMLFDGHWNEPDTPFSLRTYALEHIFGGVTHLGFGVIEQRRMLREAVPQWIETQKRLNPDAEGFVLRNANDLWKPGHRGWGYQKIVHRPILDLRILRFEEGKGKNAGGVGKLIASYNGDEIGVSPGKMSYDTRKTLWRRWLNQDIGFCETMIAAVEYKRDDTYTALREPTFQYWRPDKKEADA